MKIKDAYDKVGAVAGAAVGGLTGLAAKLAGTVEGIVFRDSIGYFIQTSYDQINLGTDSVYEQYLGKAVEVVFGVPDCGGVTGPIFVGAGLGLGAAIGYFVGRRKLRKRAKRPENSVNASRM
ncbi:MAG: hypothetical protein EAX81_07590 [Candidatus Thorarchaeota archaeon]|nr:hypothetical protein [Candidatus Thorarchaeota archaeon]